MRLALVIAGLAACTDPYLRVVVEGADPELTVAPVDVQVGVYGGHQRIDFDYTARLSQKGQSVPATDFTLMLGDTTDAQLRIAIPTTTTTWFTDAKVQGEGTIHLPLFEGESAITSASYRDGDGESSVLFGPGIAMAWIDQDGVELRIERDPDFLISRAEVLAPDPAAHTLRLASRPNPLGYGPDVFAVGWIGGDGLPRIETRTIAQTYAVHALGTTAIDELALGGSYRTAPFALVIAELTDGALAVSTLDETGTVLAGPFSVATSATTIVGVTASRDGIAVGWRDAASSHLALLDASGNLVTSLVPDGDLVSLSLTTDGTRLLTLERRASQMFQISYFSALAPTGSEVALGTTTVGGHASVSACTAAWSEVRDDGSNTTDLRFALLDTNGSIVGDTHLLNVEQTGDHDAPTSLCASATRAYTTFYQHTTTSDPLALLRLRRIPVY